MGYIVAKVCSKILHDKNILNFSKKNPQKFAYIPKFIIEINSYNTIHTKSNNPKTPGGIHQLL